MRISNAAKSILASKPEGKEENTQKEILKLQLSAMNFEAKREEHLKSPKTQSLGFGLYLTPVVHSINRGTRTDLALGDGRSVSILRSRRKIILDDEEGEIPF